MLELTGRGMTLADGDLVPVTACPACGSQSLTSADSIHFRGRRLRYSRCRGCNLLFMNPMPTQRWYDGFYAEEFWEEKAASQGASDVRIHKGQWRKEIGRAREIYRFLGDHGGKIGGNGSVLEIGCAYGLVSRWLGERLSLTPLGVEPSTAAREFAERHAGVAIAHKRRADWNRGPRLSRFASSSWPTCLRTSASRGGFYEILKRKLAPGGLLMIETPNSLTRRGWSIFHPFIYSRHALSHMLTSSGFDVAGL